MRNRGATADGPQRRRGVAAALDDATAASAIRKRDAIAAAPRVPHGYSITNARGERAAASPPRRRSEPRPVSEYPRRGRGGAATRVHEYPRINDRMRMRVDEAIAAEPRRHRRVAGRSRDPSRNIHVAAAAPTRVHGTSTYQRPNERAWTRRSRRQRGGVARRSRDASYQPCAYTRMQPRVQPQPPGPYRRRFVVHARVGRSAVALSRPRARRSRRRRGVDASGDACVPFE